MPLLVLVALLAAAPSPVVVVPAFQVPDGPTGAKSNIGLALASVAETDLAQARHDLGRMKHLGCNFVKMCQARKIL